MLITGASILGRLGGSRPPDFGQGDREGHRRGRGGGEILLDYSLSCTGRRPMFESGDF